MGRLVRSWQALSLPGALVYFLNNSFIKGVSMYTIKPFDVQAASDSDFQAALTFSNLIRAEIFPDDPPRTLETLKKTWQANAMFEKQKDTLWIATDKGEHIAHLWAFIEYYEDNRHLMSIELLVHPDYRRKGLAKQLLPKVLETAKNEERTHIISWTHSTIAAGTAVAERMGAKRGLEGHTNQLVLSELDQSLMATWIKNVKENAKEFELGFWIGAYPEEKIEDIASLYSVMSTAPRGELDIEDWQVKVEDLRQSETYHRAVGIERWAAYVRHVPSGELAGYSFTTYQPDHNPLVVWQGDTGVLPKYRGHGLGKWLKAGMLEKILHERPQVKFIRTGNADSNAPMLAINHALGFKPYIAWIDWQLEVKVLEAYLAKNLA
jgi:mycothiol synthase